MGDRRTLPPSNLDGAQLDQMRSWVNSGKGSAALFEKSERWRSEEKYMRELATRVKDKLKRAGAVTESKGDEAMQNAMSPVVLWTEVAADNALAQAERMEEQAYSFSRVQSSVPAASEEKPVPEENFLDKAWAGLTGGKTDNEQALAHNEKLRQDAVTAFKSYDGASQTTVSATPTFTAPPPGGVETGVQSGSHPEVGGMGSGSASGGGTGAPAGTRSSWSGNLDPSGTGTGSGTSSGSGSGTGTAGQSAGRPGSGATPPAGSHSAWQRPPAGETPGYRQGGTPGGSQGAGRAAGSNGVVGGTGRAPGNRIPIRGLGSGSGAGTGAGTGAGVGRGAGSGAGRGFGPGGQSGIGRSASATSANGAATSGSGGGRGAAAGAPRGGGQQGEEDEEHDTPSYLVGDYGYFDDDLPRVAPPVIGE